MMPDTTPFNPYLELKKAENKFCVGILQYMLAKESAPSKAELSMLARNVDKKSFGRLTGRTKMSARLPQLLHAIDRVQVELSMPDGEDKEILMDFLHYVDDRLIPEPVPSQIVGRRLNDRRMGMRVREFFNSCEISSFEFPQIK